MKNYLLDTNIVQHYLGIFGQKHKNLMIIVLANVMDELAYLEKIGRAHLGTTDLINQSISKGIVQLIGVPSKQISDYRIPADNALIESLRNSKNQILVSDDRSIVNLAKAEGLNAITGREFVAILSSQALQEQLVDVKGFESQIKRPLYISIGLGIIFFASGVLCTLFIDRILSSISLWLIYLVGLFSGVIAYWFRQRSRLIYGVLEVLFGIFILFNVSIPTNFSSNNTEIFVFLFKFCTSIYIIVRGMDNIDKKIRLYPIGKYWENWFNEKG